MVYSTYEVRVFSHGCIGRDETVRTERDSETPADIIDRYMNLSCYLDEFYNVIELLTNAPADRAWRRRAPLVICRARRLASATRNSPGHKRLKMTSDGLEDWASAICNLDNGVFRHIVSFL